MTMIEMLMVRLQNGVVSFTYQKSDGSVRKAKGTLLKSYCPEVKGNGKPTPEHLQIYYDVEKGSWRCFKKDSLIEVKL